MPAALRMSALATAGLLLSPLLLPILGGLGVAHAAPAPARCRNATTTLEMQDCLSAELAAVEQQLQRYRAAARQRLSQEAGDAAARRQLLTAFDDSQQAWLRYRDSACQTVWLRWQGGTIRGPMALQCRIDLSRERTHRLWTDALTTMDGPPLLPEPGPQPGPSGG